MRSKSDLQAAAAAVGIPLTGKEHRSELMDLLRTAIGSFDPDLQIDPAKAVDLKRKVSWGSPAPFSTLSDYFGPRWVVEPKLDGARMRVFLGTAANTLTTGRRSVVTYTYIERADNFPHFRDLAVPELSGTILDGELMPPVPSLTTVSGVTTRGTLNSAMALVNVNPAASVATQEKYGKAVFMAFDVLAVKGEPIMHWPLSARREALEQIMAVLSAKEPAFQIVAQAPASEDAVQACLDAGFEGAMLKRVDSQYLAGKRMPAWGKVKRQSTGDFFIIGSVPGNGRNKGKVGSIRVAYAASPDDAYGVYCADVAGISDAFRDELTDPLTGGLAEEWLGRVIEVQGQEVTKNGRIRHPMFVRVRPDKEPADCTPECSIGLFEES